MSHLRQVDLSPSAEYSPLFLHTLPVKKKRQAVRTLKEHDRYSEEALETVLWRMQWLETAREKQVAPPDWDWESVWLILAGRGFGKTLTGAQEIGFAACVNEDWRLAVIGATFDDCRKTCFEGVSGLMNVIPKYYIRDYNRTTLELWTTVGSKIQGYSAESPERLRGPEHHMVWCDELGAWEHAVDTWDNMMFGLRAGDRPRVIVTTTPKPRKLLRSLVADPSTKITTGSTFENKANLPKAFLATLRKKYEGTRIGRQELYAELLDQAEGALWTREMIDAAQVSPSALPSMKRLVVALDPAATSEEHSNEFGIIVAGLGSDNRGYVLEDHTKRMSPGEWGRLAVALYVRWKADVIVGEANNGGDMIEAVIRAADHPAAKRCNYRKVWASRGKHTRAEPVAALYEKGEVRHVRKAKSGYDHHEHGYDLSNLEDEMCTWEPLTAKDSPNRMDALVWALTELMVEEGIPEINIGLPGNVGGTSAKQTMADLGKLATMAHVGKA